MNRSPTTSSPRKTPVQARSANTLDAICEAAIQVLLTAGSGKLTTSRVAQRAGVSVGSLYQYFPNKQALMATVLERHLVQTVEAIERTLLERRGATLAEIASGLVTAFFQAKLKERDAAAALYMISSGAGIEKLIHQLTLRAQKAVAEALHSARDGKIDDAPLVSMVMCGTLIAPIQHVLSSGMKRADALKVQDELIKMNAAYLRAIAT